MRKRCLCLIQEHKRKKHDQKKGVALSARPTKPKKPESTFTMSKFKNVPAKIKSHFPARKAAEKDVGELVAATKQLRFAQ